MAPTYLSPLGGESGRHTASCVIAALPPRVRQVRLLEEEAGMKSQVRSSLKQKFNHQSTKLHV